MALNRKFEAKDIKSTMNCEGAMETCPKCGGKQAYAWAHIDFKHPKNNIIKEACFDSNCGYSYEQNGPIQSPNI